MLIGYLISRERTSIHGHYGSTYSTLEAILIELYCVGYNKPRLSSSRLAPSRPPRAPVFSLARRSFSSAVPGGPRDQYDTVSTDTGAAAPDNKARGPAL